MNKWSGCWGFESLRARQISFSGQSLVLVGLERQKSWLPTLATKHNFLHRLSAGCAIGACISDAARDSLSHPVTKEMLRRLNSGDSEQVDPWSRPESPIWLSVGRRSVGVCVPD
jgi:hypothetical protein